MPARSECEFALLEDPDLAEFTAGDAPASRVTTPAPEGPEDTETADQLLPEPTTRPFSPVSPAGPPESPMDLLQSDTIVVAHMMGTELASAGLKAWMAAYIRISSHLLGMHTELQPEDLPFLEFLRANPAVLRPPKRPVESPEQGQHEKRHCNKPTPPRDPRLRRRSRSAGGDAPPAAREHHQPPQTIAPWKAPSPTSILVRCGLKGVVQRNLNVFPLQTEEPPAPASAEARQDEALAREPQQPQPSPPAEGLQQKQPSGPPTKEPEQPQQAPPPGEPKPQRATTRRHHQTPGPKTQEPQPESQPQLCPPPEGPATKLCPPAMDPPSQKPISAELQPPAAGPSQEPHTNLGPPPQADPQTSYASKAAAADTAEVAKKQKKAQQQPQPPQQPRKEKYPHIEAAVLPQWYKVCGEIAKELGRAPNSKNMGRGVRFEPQSADERTTGVERIPAG
ncbi:basic salivary proline-rich protein 2-like [Cydia fagiglandana]|uniref:basic salivary proline-rich protein 2-like n=1 Tax=Cydia fagiglandana TaxID=1458189 RepID=UPI002FEDF9AB